MRCTVQASKPGGGARTALSAPVGRVLTRDAGLTPDPSALAGPAGWTIRLLNFAHRRAAGDRRFT
jgi:hypothetical protein